MRKHHLQQGAALIELALAIPFMILLSMIVIEFGRALYEYNTVTKSVRDAARYLSVQQPNTGCPTAQGLVVYGSGTTPLAPGLQTSIVSCAWQTSGTFPLNSTTVTVAVTGYRFQSMVSSVFGTQLTNGGINFGPISATMRTLT